MIVAYVLALLESRGVLMICCGTDYVKTRSNFTRRESGFCALVVEGRSLVSGMKFAFGFINLAAKQEKSA